MFVGFTVGGALVVLLSFALLGFPLTQVLNPNIVWWKLTFLVIVLVYPFSVRKVSSHRTNTDPTVK